MKFLYLSLIALSVMFIASTNAYAIHPLPIPVLSMQSNTIGHIYIKFSTYYHNQTLQLGPMNIYDANLTNHNPLKLDDLSIIPNRTSITLDSNSTTIDYTVTAKNDLKGVYALPIEHLSDLSPYVVGENPLQTYQERDSKSYCHMAPLVIGLNSSQIKEETLDKFVSLNSSNNCPISLIDMVFVESKDMNRLSETIPSANNTNSSGINFGSTTSSVIIKDESPLQQSLRGIASKDIQCKSGFMLVLKSEDGSPTCVKPDTANVLIERGWAKALQ